MSYDIAVWVSQGPLDDTAAGEEYEVRADNPDQDEMAPDPRIVALVAGLLQRWPEGRDDGIWSIEPVLEETGGDFLELSMVFGEHLDDVCERAGALAREHGLIAYDPQRSCLL